MKNTTAIILVCLVIISCNNGANSNPELSDQEVSEEVISNQQIGEAIIKGEKMKVDSIGILLYYDFFELDAVSPFSVHSSIIGTSVFFVAQKKGIIKSSSGLQITVTSILTVLRTI